MNELNKIKDMVSRGETDRAAALIKNFISQKELSEKQKAALIVGATSLFLEIDSKFKRHYLDFLLQVEKEIDLIQNQNLEAKTKQRIEKVKEEIDTL